MTTNDLVVMPQYVVNRLFGTVFRGRSEPRLIFMLRLVLTYILIVYIHVGLFNHSRASIKMND